MELALQLRYGAGSKAVVQTKMLCKPRQEAAKMARKQEGKVRKQEQDGCKRTRGRVVDDCLLDEHSTSDERESVGDARKSGCKRRYLPFCICRA